MKREKCKICGKIRLTQSSKQGWICIACQEKAEGLLKAAPKEIPQSICGKCRKLIEDQCPFSRGERRVRIIRCNKFVPKNAERNKRRWAKYEL